MAQNSVINEGEDDDFLHFTESSVDREESYRQLTSNNLTIITQYP